MLINVKGLIKAFVGLFVSYNIAFAHIVLYYSIQTQTYKYLNYMQIFNLRIY